MSEQSTIDSTSVDELKVWLIGWLAGEMAISQSDVDPSRSFLSYGMDSVQAMTMVGDLESHLGLRLSPTLAWDYPDIDALAGHLANQAGPASTTALNGTATASTHAEAANLLADLDRLSDGDVDRLLRQYLDGSS